jgi:hypothetical protein
VVFPKNIKTLISWSKHAILRLENIWEYLTVYKLQQGVDFDAQYTILDSNERAEFCTGDIN